MRRLGILRRTKGYHERAVTRCQLEPGGPYSLEQHEQVHYCSCQHFVLICQSQTLLSIRPTLLGDLREMAESWTVAAVSSCNSVVIVEPTIGYENRAGGVQWTHGYQTRK